ncbi:MAG TPA: hydroxyisourate hydrolase [Candidatus Caenarcaniphilales bacterium]|nr:hydroxyisourate hydrolase [Candidatus Caenarcaniphilales bacterium]
MSEARPTISTHVLDTGRGRPATGVTVELYRVDGGERLVGRGTTDADGRIRQLLDAPLEGGDYRIDFLVDGALFRRLSVVLRIVDTARSYHVPLLLAPYSMATYLGS